MTTPGTLHHVAERARIARNRQLAEREALQQAVANLLPAAQPAPPGPVSGETAAAGQAGMVDGG